MIPRPSTFLALVVGAFVVYGLAKVFHPIPRAILNQYREATKDHYPPHAVRTDLTHLLDGDAGVIRRATILHTRGDWADGRNHFAKIQFAPADVPRIKPLLLAGLPTQGAKFDDADGDTFANLNDAPSWWCPQDLSDPDSLKLDVAGGYIRIVFSPNTGVLYVHFWSS